MPVAFPLSLRTIIRSSKSRSQPAAFRMAEPRRGAGYADASGSDTPVFWDITLRFTTAEAAAFVLWFVNVLQRGVLEFTLPIRTEFGVQTHTVRFLPQSLLNVREMGEIWEYTATIMARAQLIPNGSFELDLSNAGFDNNGATSAVGTLLSGLDSSTTYIVSLPPYKTYAGVSYWPSDSSLLPGYPPAGQYWGNRLFIRKGAGADEGPTGSNTVSFGTYAGYLTGEAARIAFPQGTLTGSSQYKFWFYDTDPGNNRGGLSLLLTPATGANPNAPFYIPTADSGFASYVKLMLRTQGTNGAGAAVDSSSTPRTLTTTGVTHLVGYSRFANTALFFPSSGNNNISTPYASPDHIGSADFKVRAWVKLTVAPSADMVIIGLWQSTTKFSWIFGINSSRAAVFYTSTNGSTGDFSKNTGANLVPLDQWVELCAWRVGGRLRIAIGGTVYYDQANTETFYNPTTTPLIVGGYYVPASSVAAPLRSCWIGELQLRIGNGGTDTGNYTPSLYALPSATATPGPV